MEDGTFVGAGLGASVGIVVGRRVGLLDGDAVGSKDGRSVGDVVGLSEGINVGASVGWNVGLLVGRAVGTFVGYVVGSVVGMIVGLAVGDIVVGSHDLLRSLSAQHRTLARSFDVAFSIHELLIPPLDDPNATTIPSTPQRSRVQHSSVLSSQPVPRATSACSSFWEHNRPPTALQMSIALLTVVDA